MPRLLVYGLGRKMMNRKIKRKRMRRKSDRKRKRRNKREREIERNRNIMGETDKIPETKQKQQT